MKKVSLFVLSLCSGMALFAQTQPQLVTPMAIKTRFGVRGGVNLSNLHISDQTSSNVGSPNSKAGVVGGIFANIPLGVNFRLQPEVDYSGQGARMNGTYTIGTATSTYNYTQKLTYINVPVMLQLQTNSGFFVETGPQVGYLMKASLEDNSVSANANGDNKNAFEKLDFAWAAGIGYLSRIGLGIDARYNYGIRDILNKDYSSYSSSNGKLKNTVAQISLIYQFGANK